MWREYSTPPIKVLGDYKFEKDSLLSLKKMYYVKVEMITYIIIRKES